MRRIITGLTIVLAAVTVAPTAVAAAEPDWILQLPDSRRDLVDLIGSPARTGKYPKASRIDIRRLRVGIEEGALVAVFDTTGEIPLEPVGRSTVSFSLRFDHEGDGFEDTTVAAGNQTGWRTAVLGAASPLPLEVAPAVVRGQAVTLRVPLAWLEAAPDVRVAGVAMTEAGYPKWAIGLDPLALADEMRARGVDDIPLEWWFDQVPDGSQAFVPLDGTQALQTAIAALPVYAETTVAAPLRDVGLLLRAPQPTGGSGDVADDIRAFVAAHPDAQAALGQVPMGDLGFLSAIDLEQSISPCETPQVGQVPYGCVLTFGALLRVYALTGDEGAFELIARLVAATTAELKDRYRDAYLGQLESALEAYGSQFPRLGQAAVTERTSLGEFHDEFLSSLEQDDMWTFDATGWTPEPTEPDPDYAAAAIEVCLDKDDLSKEMRDDLEAGPTLHDQRGDAGALLLWVASEYVYSCFVYWDDFVHAPGWETLGNSYTAVFSDAPNVPVGVTSDSGGSVLEIEGIVDPAAARVEIETQAGPTIEATHGQGHFIAWWPQGDPAKAVRAFASDGALLGEVTANALGRFPFPSDPDESTASDSSLGDAS